MTIQGLLYDKPSMLNNPTTGGLAVPTYDPVALNSTYPCVNRGECNGHLYVLPTTPGSPSNFGFLRSKPGEYAMFSVDINWISKMAEFPIKIDGMLMGIVPVPNQGGGAPTWALAYSDRLNGLYGVSLSGESSEGEEKIQERGLSGMIGGVVGGLVAVVLAIFAVFFWRNKRQQKKSNKTSVQDAPQYTEDKHPTLVDANCMKLPADYSEVKGNGHLPKIEETPLSPLLEKLLSQSQQLQFHSRPQAQPYTRPYPEIDPQQYPQSAPYLAQMYHAYPQPQMYQNFMQQHQPFSSTEYTASTTIPAPLPVSASVALASAPATIPTTVPAVAINSATAEAVQHEVQLSNHPRPKVFTTVSGTDPETVAAFSTAAGL
ncbi:hypothetical protein BGW41_006499 [Actinomortierella wolfii]|nr:hypothetical protein BGW41_006499 [Actinomortierella wolfii]